MPLIIPSNSISDLGYNVDNSLRFDDGSSDYLSRTPSGAGNKKIFTFSAWVKRSNIGVNVIFQQGTASNYFKMNFQNDYLRWRGVTSGSNQAYLTTNRVFRDTSAWYHIVARFDSTNATAGDRMRLYINGVEETSFSTDINPSLNYESFINSTDPIDIGRDNASNDSFFDGYMAEVCLIDGQALDPTSFGEFDSDTNIWKPIDVSGLTFGTNGFYLDFENSGSLGADVSGNGNNFTVNNLTSIDQTTDTCTNNFCTLNPLTTWTEGFTLAEGNTEIQMDNTNEGRGALGTFGVTQGKWYWEAKYVSRSNPTFAQVGITDANTNENQGYGEYDYSYRGETANSNGLKVNNGTFTSYGDTWTTGDIIGVALDLDNNKIFFSKNGTFQASGNPVTGANPTFTITDPLSTDGGAYFPAIGKEDADTGTFSFNFGNPSFTISSGNSDGNGYGNFEYSVPSGYYALNTKNLAEYG